MPFTDRLSLTGRNLRHWSEQQVLLHVLSPCRLHVWLFSWYVVAWVTLESHAYLCAAGSSKTIRLPGSHGHVFPWDPPSFGVPDAILVKLAQKLREDILRLATANARMIIDRSEHSNPERLKMPQIGPGWRLRVLAAFEKSTSRPRE